MGQNTSDTNTEQETENKEKITHQLVEKFLLLPIHKFDEITKFEVVESYFNDKEENNIKECLFFHL